MDLQWNIWLLVILLTVNIHNSEGQESVRLNCHSHNARMERVEIIHLEHPSDRECPSPGVISCTLRASRVLVGMRLLRPDPFMEEDQFPVNTWTDRQMEIILTDSQITLIPNTTGSYRYPFPRTFDTVSRPGSVDVECKFKEQSMSTTPTLDSSATTPTIETAAASLSTLHLLLIVLGILLIIAFTVAIVIILLRKHKFRHPQKTGGAKPKALTLNKINSSSKPRKNGTKKDLGVAVYIDPTRPNEYDNKDRKTDTPTSGEYSYSYVDLAAKKKNKEKDLEVNRQDSGDYDQDKEHQVTVDVDKPLSGEYSYSYMDVAQAAKKQNHGEESEPNTQNSDYDSKDQVIVDVDSPTSNDYSYPYMDVAQTANNKSHDEYAVVNKQDSGDTEGNDYSYTYSAALNK